MQFSDDLGNGLDGESLVQLVCAFGQGPPRPTEEKKVLKHSTIVIVW